MDLCLCIVSNYCIYVLDICDLINGGWDVQHHSPNCTLDPIQPLCLLRGKRKGRFYEIRILTHDNCSCRGVQDIESSQGGRTGSHFGRMRCRLQSRHTVGKSYRPILPHLLQWRLAGTILLLDFVYGRSDTQLVYVKEYYYFSPKAPSFSRTVVVQCTGTRSVNRRDPEPKEFKQPSRRKI